MTDTFYSTVESVISRTGIQPADLGFDEDEEESQDDALETFLESLLVEVADLMNRRMRRDYLIEDDIPAGLHGIAADIAADAVRTMVATRQTPVVRIDDFAITVLRAKMLSPDVLARLRLYGHQGLGTISLTNDES